MPAKTLAFTFGIGLFQQLSYLPDWRHIIVMLLLTFCFSWQKNWIGAIFCCGWLWANGFAAWHLTYNPLPTALEGQDLKVQGVITSLPQGDERKTRFDFKLTAPADLPRKLKLSWYHPQQLLKAGQHWALAVKLKKPHGTLNPGGFDYERWLFTQGIAATGYVRQPQKAQLLAQDASWQNITVLRQAIGERIAHVKELRFPEFIKALTIGDTGDITQAQWRILRNTGTLHLIAISGSHISLVAGMVYLLTRYGWARTNLLWTSPQRIAAISAIITAIAYAFLAGFAVPTQRALIMLSVAMLGVIGQRHVLSTQILSIAILLILLFDPLAVLSPGFWLSCVAVALIFFVVTGRLAKPTYWTGIFKVHGIMALGLAPLLLVFFQQIPLVSPIANLVAVPVVSLAIVPVALLAVLLLWPAPTLAITLFKVVDFILGWLWWLLGQMATWPFAVTQPIATSFPALLLASFGIIVLFMPKGLPGRWLGGVLCLPLLLHRPATLSSGDLRVTLLDVGQGLATVIQTAKHVLVFDTGIKFSDQADSSKSILLPFFAQQGITHLDGLVISHGDNDHIGGTASLLAEYPAGWLYTSAVQQLQQFAPQTCVQGQHWTWDSVEFTMLGPSTSGFLKENDNSCVLHIKTAHGSILLTGDIEKTAEAWLVNSYGQTLQANLLVAPHHGSNSSSSPAFLAAVAPEFVLIPAGYHNPFHFPHPTVLNRYQANHIQWLNTAEQGAIEVNMNHSGIKIDSFRARIGKYWNTASPNKPNF